MVHLWKPLYAIWKKIDYLVSGYCFRAKTGYKPHISVITCSLLSILFYNEGDPGKGGFLNARLMKMGYLFKNT
jgi:hypothetical protein